MTIMLLDVLTRSGARVRRCAWCGGVFDPAVTYSGPVLRGASTRAYCSTEHRRLGHNWLDRRRRRGRPGGHRGRVEQLAFLDAAS